MSDTESFINEVNEEVRRDRLFAVMRRYGWIAILLVVALVGGAAYNEWRKATERSQAEAAGDQILNALDQQAPNDRLKALDAMTLKGDAEVLVNLVAAAEAVQSDKRPEAIEKLKKVAADEAAPRVYRDLATLKLEMLEGSARPADERRAALAKLAEPGAPFRLVAEEQLALIDLSEGDKEGAIKRLRAIMADNEVTAGLRRRASQLIVAEGGSLSEQ